MILDRGRTFSKIIDRGSHRGASYRGTWTGCLNCVITGTVCWNNFLRYNRLILLRYFHQKILKEKRVSFNKYNFFGQVCFFASPRKPGLSISRLYFCFMWHYELSPCKVSMFAKFMHESLDRVSWTSTTQVLYLNQAYFSSDWYRGLTSALVIIKY